MQQSQDDIQIIAFELEPSKTHNIDQKIRTIDWSKRTRKELSDNLRHLIINQNLNVKKILFHFREQKAEQNAERNVKQNVREQDTKGESKSKKRLIHIDNGVLDISDFDERIKQFEDVDQLSKFLQPYTYQRNNLVFLDSYNLFVPKNIMNYIVVIRNNRFQGMIRTRMFGRGEGRYMEMNQFLPSLSVLIKQTEDPGPYLYCGLSILGNMMGLNDIRSIDWIGYNVKPVKDYVDPNIIGNATYHHPILGDERKNTIWDPLPKIETPLPYTFTFVDQ